jgi:hypothetical protein
MRATGNQKEMKTAKQMLYARVRFFLKQLCLFDLCGLGVLFALR